MARADQGPTAQLICAAGKVSRSADSAAVAITTSPMQQGRKKTMRRGLPTIAVAGKARFRIEYSIALYTWIDGFYAECNADGR